MGPVVRSLPSATLRYASVSEQDNMSYLLTCEATGHQLLVDAADRAPDLLEMIGAGAGDGSPRLEHLVTSHKHWDHHRALPQIATTTGATTYAGTLDAPELPTAPDRLLEHGDTLQVGELELEVIHLRGHTPGSVALAWTAPDEQTHLFVGDCLFPGGVGNTFGDKDAFDQLLSDVEERLFARFPDSAVIYPGHGATTTLGAERPQLAEWRERGW